MKSILLLAIALAAFQTQPGLEEFKQYWAVKDAEFKDPARSPLKPEELAKFTSIPKYNFNPEYRVQASWEPVLGAIPFGIPTTQAKVAEYKLAGYFTFKLKGQTVKLPAYNSVKHANHPVYKDRLFILFTDPTNGQTTYTGGRYIDMESVKGKSAYLDFNKAYNPYCVYHEKYNCPIPPKECHIPVPIEAGARVIK